MKTINQFLLMSCMVTALSLFSCGSGSSNEEEELTQEEQEMIDDLLKKQEERTDSMKRELIKE
jgi:hypothetical protein